MNDSSIVFDRKFLKNILLNTVFVKGFGTS